MHKTLRWLMLGILVMLVTACGSTSTTVAPADSTATMVAVPATTILTSSVSVKGITKVVLTDTKGFTLYYRTDESAAQVKCTGGCLAIWPPILVTSGMPTGTSTLTGKLTLLNDVQRLQAVYNGHPLYTFAKDTAAGQTTGDGVGGIWFVVTPDIAAANGSSA